MATAVSSTSSLPRVVFDGIQDTSAEAIPSTSYQIPIRLPLFWGYSPWGRSDTAGYITSDTLNQYYGSDAINPLTKFFTHQSVFLRSHLNNSGKALFMRLIPDDAKVATLRLLADVYRTDVPLYKRNVDGSYQLDTNGNKQPVDSNQTVPGYQIKFSVVEITDPDTNFGQGAAVAGSYGSGETVSRLIPICDFKARFIGAKGKNLGLRLSAPNVNSNEPADATLQSELSSFLFRASLISRTTVNSSASVISNLDGTNYINFSFNPDAVDLTTSIAYYGADALINKYESIDPTSFQGYGNFEEVHFYDENVLALVTDVQTSENAYVADSIASPYLVNFLTGVDVYAVPYQTLVIDGISAGGLAFTESTNYYMLGGSDGTMSNATYNTAVDSILDVLETTDVPYWDIARMPYDSVWDSGFPVATKLKFANFHSLRPDVVIHSCCQDVTRPLNTPAEDSSIGVTLRTRFRAMSESDIYGTKSARFFLASCAGKVIGDNTYTKIVPFLEWVLIKGAAYLSADDGAMINANSFSRGEKNIFNRYYQHNAGTKRELARLPDWTNGLNVPMFSNLNQLFYPGLRSIHEVENSILSSYMNVVIACNLQRIGYYVWQEVTGDDTLTDDEFNDLVISKVNTRTSGKYDGRVNITPTVTITTLDAALGFSKHLKIAMAGEVPDTVLNLLIQTTRRTSATTTA